MDISKNTETSAVSILLTNAQAARMDEVRAAIRRANGHSISRSALVRAMTTAVLTLHEDWMRCRTEGDVCATILCRINDRIDIQSGTRRIQEVNSSGALRRKASSSRDE